MGAPHQVQPEANAMKVIEVDVVDKMGSCCDATRKCNIAPASRVFYGLVAICLRRGVLFKATVRTNNDDLNSCHVFNKKD